MQIYLQFLADTNTIFLKVSDNWQCSSLDQRSNETNGLSCSHSCSTAKTFKASAAEPGAVAGLSPAWLHSTISRYTGLRYRDTIFSRYEPYNKHYTIFPDDQKTKRVKKTVAISHESGKRKSGSNEQESVTYIRESFPCKLLVALGWTTEEVL